jgi:hypothetical protein
MVDRKQSKEPKADEKPSKLEKKSIKEHKGDMRKKSMVEQPAAIDFFLQLTSDRKFTTQQEM